MCQNKFKTADGCGGVSDAPGFYRSPVRENREMNEGTKVWVDLDLLISKCR